MPPTIVVPNRDAYTRYVVPKMQGTEDRDVRAYPLPPNTSFRGVDAVIAGLRAEGHVVERTCKRERLVDWTTTRRADQHDEERYEGDGTVLHFTGGGWYAEVIVDGNTFALMPEHLRMPGALLARILRGRP
jgi:hypothetical protein